MSFAKVYSAQPSVLGAKIIDVEIDISKGLNAFSLVGLGDKSVEESKDRVASAIKNSGFRSPKQTNQKVVVSLAPANLRKEGPVFDLAIAIVYLKAIGEIEFDPRGKIFLGELSLDGGLRDIQGVLSVVMEAKRCGYSEIYLPEINALEAQLIPDINIFPLNNLSELIDHLGGKKTLDSTIKKITTCQKKNDELDFSDIVGQDSAKRGLEIAAAGGHNIAMYGPPGTGKTMLAKAFASIVPDLSFEEVIEITSIHSYAGVLKGNIVEKVPIRSPHHTASYVSIVGGGSIPKPGEITLAHRGVLFLDEFPEFDKKVIETLRQPLEEKQITISRAKGSLVFPANFILIAAMNPCPCGYRGSKNKECICRAEDLLKYQRKISGPIVDRIDMWVEVSAIDHKNLLRKEGENAKTSPDARSRVKKARETQKNRFKSMDKKIKLNSEIDPRDIGQIIKIDSNGEEILNKSAEKLSLSARSYHRIIKLAQTIADLEDHPSVSDRHILEALQYRPRH
jgi:magnesium chelatase family protein